MSVGCLARNEFSWLGLKALRDLSFACFWISYKHENKRRIRMLLANFETIVYIAVRIPKSGLGCWYADKNETCMVDMKASLM